MSRSLRFSSYFAFYRLKNVSSDCRGIFPAKESDKTYYTSVRIASLVMSVGRSEFHTMQNVPGPKSISFLPAGGRLYGLAIINPLRLYY